MILLIASMLSVPAAVPAQGRVLHDEISSVFQGTWAPTAAGCRDADGVDLVRIDGQSVNYYEGNDYLLLGIEFGGAMTKREGSGSLFNGRFTSRSESRLLGENNIRLEIDDRDRDVLYRYPIGEDGEPIATREVRDVRCPGK